MPESTHEQSNDTQENIAARLQDAIKKPEATEAYSIGTLYGQDHPLRRLDLSLGRRFVPKVSGSYGKVLCTA